MSRKRCTACGNIHTCPGAPAERTPDAPPTWFGRWRVYPWSVAGHIAQGAAATAMAALAALLFYNGIADGNAPPHIAGGTALGFAAIVWTAGFFLYQVGSGFRKFANLGHTDTMGLDSFDFAVGAIIAGTVIAGVIIGAAALPGVLP